MSELLVKQQEFPPMVAKLIEFAYRQGFAVTLGEAYRTPEQAALNAQKGVGIADSLHTERLAIDLMLFRNGVYLTQTQDYLALGVYWESLGGAWGGRFMRPDGNHFSLAFGGRQ